MNSLDGHVDSQVIKTRLHATKHQWQRLFVGLLMTLTVLVSLVSFGSGTIKMATSSDTTKAQAFGWSDVWHPIQSVFDNANAKLQNVTGDGNLGTHLETVKHGGSWILYPNYGLDNGSNGFISSGDGGALSTKDFDGANWDNVKAFSTFLWWSHSQGLLVGYVGGLNAGLYIIRVVARTVAGLILGGALIFNILIQYFGSVIYNALSFLNIFSYVSPNSSSLATTWTSDNPIMAPFVQFLGMARNLGYIITIALFAVGLFMIVMGIKFRNATSRGSIAKGVVLRFLLSIFAMTGAVFILSSMMTVGSEWMQKGGSDDLGQTANVGGLILDYKDYVSANYVTLNDKNKDDKDVVKNNGWFMVPTDFSGVGDTNTMNTYFGGTADSIVQAMSKQQNKIIEPQQIYAMNVAAGAIDDSTSGNDNGTVGGTGHSEDDLGTLFNGSAMQLISGWVSGSTSTSKQIGGQFGSSSAIAQMYAFLPDDNGKVVRQNDDSGISAIRTYDYSLPGRSMAPFLYIRAVVVIVATAYFALQMYFIVLQSIFDMWKTVLSKMPGAFAFGSASSVFMLFAAVIIMFIQIVIARLSIAFYSAALAAPQKIFNYSITGVAPTKAFAADKSLSAVTDTLSVASATTVGGVILNSALTALLAVVMLVALVKMNKTFGSSLGESAARIAMTLAGISEMDPRMQKGMSEGASRGGNSLGAAAMGAMRGASSASKEGSSSMFGGLRNIASGMAGGAAAGYQAHDDGKVAGMSAAEKGASSQAGRASAKKNNAMSSLHKAAKDAKAQSSFDKTQKNMSAKDKTATGAAQAAADLGKASGGPIPESLRSAMERGANASNGKDGEGTLGSRYNALHNAERAMKAEEKANDSVDSLRNAMAAQDQSTPQGKAKYNALARQMEKAEGLQKDAQVRSANAAKDLQRHGLNNEANSMRSGNPAEIKAAKRATQRDMAKAGFQPRKNVTPNGNNQTSANGPKSLGSGDVKQLGSNGGNPQGSNPPKGAPKGSPNDGNNGSPKGHTNPSGSTKPKGSIIPQGSPTPKGSTTPKGSITPKGSGSSSGSTTPKGSVTPTGSNSSISSTNSSTVTPAAGGSTSNGGSENIINGNGGNSTQSADNSNSAFSSSSNPNNSSTQSISSGNVDASQRSQTTNGGVQSHSGFSEKTNSQPQSQTFAKPSAQPQSQTFAKPSAQPRGTGGGSNSGRGTSSMGGGSTSRPAAPKKTFSKPSYKRTANTSQTSSRTTHPTFNGGKGNGRLNSFRSTGSHPKSAPTGRFGRNIPHSK